MRLAVIGIAIGAACSFGLAHLLESFLFGVKPLDPLVFTLARRFWPLLRYSRSGFPPAAPRASIR
ncbi:MAG TPA: hypothetical protein VK686_04760 [Bryobacteraceae bacterium]|jgi:hypothetical protein|nr:hypothetical protein [Bryobacteraceae bacterium]